MCTRSIITFKLTFKCHHTNSDYNNRSVIVTYTFEKVIPLIQFTHVRRTSCGRFSKKHRRLNFWIVCICVFFISLSCFWLHTVDTKIIIKLIILITVRRDMKYTTLFIIKREFLSAQMKMYASKEHCIVQNVFIFCIYFWVDNQIHKINCKRERKKCVEINDQSIPLTMF